MYPTNATARTRRASGRRRRWQREKLNRDPDYRANQAAAQQRWRSRHPDYWRDYRQQHPEYTQQNRAKQRERNRGRCESVANMDEWHAKRPFASGTYRLIPVVGEQVANMDAYLVKIHVI
jgi:hypothetical protein